MSNPFTKIDTTKVIITAILGGIAWWAFSRTAKVAVETVKDVAEAVNPLDEENVFNEASQGLWYAATGSEESWGADLYDLFRYGEIDPSMEAQLEIETAIMERDETGFIPARMR